jgi:hypothetical protein
MPEMIETLFSRIMIPPCGSSLLREIATTALMGAVTRKRELLCL